MKYLFAATLLAGTASCVDNQDTPAPVIPNGKEVQVELSFGFADEEDGYELLGTTRTGVAMAEEQNGAFTVTQNSKVQTRVGEITKPDALYVLHVMQYTQAGALIGSVKWSAGAIAIGEKLSFTLTQADDCRLVVFARGEGNTLPSITGNLSDVQKLTMASSIFKNIPTENATQAQMNKMPYVLHLPHVNVTSDGKLQSLTGAHDARLLLKRLATKLTVNWNYAVPGYKLKQLLFQSIPLNFAIVDEPDNIAGTYPSLVSQFTTLEVPVTDAATGSYSCWVPANVRGENAAATSDLQRTKANAPEGSAFLNFVAVNEKDSKKKLDYRVYIGSGASTDFNMYRNKDYVYTVDFKHVGIPTGDRRVTYIDPVPASQNNNNQLPTANCFMVAPGTSFCFDPFAYQQNGTVITNGALKTWTAARGGIKYVRLLWQTKEFGDVGDPVMGIVNSASDHTNVVDVRRTSGDITASPATDKGQCLIYCRVAANTAGGNGLIAAYDASNNILWSWHIWVTSYNPDPTGDYTVLEPSNKRKQKYEGGGTSDNSFPMMDRNLGALEGYIAIPVDEVAKSKANGLHYQWGRKDPFPGSYTTKKINSVKMVSGSTVPVDGLQNTYGPDGYTYVPRASSSTSLGDNIEMGSKTPTTVYGRPAVSDANLWGANKSALKPFYDPCPQGWRVPEHTTYKHLFTDGRESTSTSDDNNTLRSIPKNGVSDYWKKDATAGVLKDGGVLIEYDNKKNTTYFRLTGYQEYPTAFNYIGIYSNVWCLGIKEITVSGGAAYGFSVNWGAGSYSRTIAGVWVTADVQNVRCIQECK